MTTISYSYGILFLYTTYGKNMDIKVNLFIINMSHDVFV